MNVVYSARYQIDIGPHVFPTRKYALIHARLIEAGIIKPASLCLNMAVAAISAYHFSTINQEAWRAFLPFATIGVPASLLG